VAGDHVDVVDSQPHRHLDAAGEAAAEDRGGGDVRVEVGAQELVEAADCGRETGAPRSSAPAQSLGFTGEDLPPVLEWAVAPALLRQHLGQAVGEAVEGAEDPLVVVRGGALRRRLEQPHHQRSGDALRPRQGQMEVDVVAVSRVDVVAQPDAWICGLQPRRSKPLVDHR
jgi:hypothetical protein